jgi:hypothetical protein
MFGVSYMCVCRRSVAATCMQRLHAAVQAVNARLEPLHYLANAAHLVELDLQLVDFAQQGAEACDFGVGGLDRVARAVVLDLRCGLGLLGELYNISIHTSNSVDLVKYKGGIIHSAIAAESNT